jgi:hypothetical protein
MQCEERNKLFKEIDVATRTVISYPGSTNGVPQSFADVLNAEQLQSLAPCNKCVGSAVRSIACY